jgi:hypothetical protein
LELLLFLTAMFAGLLTGDRAVEMRQVEQATVAATAVVQLTDATAEAAHEAVAQQLPLRRILAAAPPRDLAADTPAPRIVRRVDERRRE